MPSRLSVVIPAYEAAATVAAAVESGFAAGADEVVVVDDGSTDDTGRVASAAGARTVRQANAGASVARQRGLESATGELVTFLDADDVLVAAGVLRSVEILSERDTVVAVGGGVTAAWPDGTERTWPAKLKELTTSAMLQAGFGPWPPGAAVIRRAAMMDPEGRLPRQLHTRYADDYELFMRLAIAGTLAAHEVPALRYTLYSGKSSRAPHAVLDCKERIRRYYGAWLGLPDHALSRRSVTATAALFEARYAQVAGRRITAAGHLARAAIAQPTVLIGQGTRFLRRRMESGLAPKSRIEGVRL